MCMCECMCVQSLLRHVEQTQKRTISRYTCTHAPNKLYMYEYVCMRSANAKRALFQSICICICIYACIHIQYIHANMCMYEYVCVRSIHVCYTYIHTYTHTRRFNPEKYMKQHTPQPPFMTVSDRDPLTHT
jgi:hypothetical protein